MSTAGGKGGHLNVPRSGAFAGPTVLDESLSDAVAATAGPEPQARAAAEEETPTAPVAPRRRGARRSRPGRIPMPDRIADSDALVPLQVKVSKTAHWDFKVATTVHASNMTRVVTALLSIYNEDPELGEALIDKAGREGRTLGELVHEALVDIAAAQ